MSSRYCWTSVRTHTTQALSSVNTAILEEKIKLRGLDDMEDQQLQKEALKIKDALTKWLDGGRHLKKAETDLELAKLVT